MEQNKRGRRAKRGGKGLYIALGLCIASAAAVGLVPLLQQEESPADPGGAPQQEQAGARQPVMGGASVVVDPQSPQQEPDPAPESLLPQDSGESAQPQPQPEPAPAEQEPPMEELGHRLEVVAPLQGEAVAVFSMDRLQYNETTGDWRIHDGVDISAPAGTAVSAACAGTVVAVRQDDLMGYLVTVEHGGGYCSTYASLQPEIRVQQGDYVSAGERLGAVGNTSLIESGQGAHLHFSVTKDGEPMDPREFLALGK